LAVIGFPAFHSAHGRPFDGDQRVDQLGRPRAVHTSLRKDRTDIGKQGDSGGIVIFADRRHKTLNRLAGAVWPLAAGYLGNREQWAQVIRGPVQHTALPRRMLN
jgi:hypothetical protein